MVDLTAEHRPGPHLAPFVEAFWSARFNVESLPLLRQKVVPTGFVEMIIHMTDDHCRLSRNGRWCSSPDYIIIGLYTTPYEVRFADLVNVFGIRLKPEAIYNLFGVPAAEFHERYEDLELVLGNPFRDLCASLREQASDEERIQLAEAYLCRQLERNQPYVTYVNHAAEMIRESGGFLRIEDLSGSVFIGQRQLERQFKQQVGITPKKYMRLARLNSVLRVLEQPRPIELTGVAFHCGYADQAHFIRDFRSFTGSAPGMFTRNREEYLVNIASVDERLPDGKDGDYVRQAAGR